MSSLPQAPPKLPGSGGGTVGSGRSGKRRRISSGGAKRQRSAGDDSADQPVQQQLSPPAAAARHILTEEELHELEAEVGEELRFDNVVKVFVTVQEPDFATPWQTLGVGAATGSGVVIETDDGKLLILTAAHVISDATFIQCQRVGAENPDKHIATVFAVRHECDLALLEVEAEKNSEFWHDLEPARLAEVPSLRSVVLVAGFPVGGEELSITEGVVSRIEGQPYSHSQRYLLAVTVDAAINEGNSGGPVFNETGELVGIAFQALEGAENTGHIIPPPVIEHFVSGVAKFGPDKYQGFPADGIKTQQLTNATLRKYLGLGDDIRGVLVNTVYFANTCDGVLQKNDILTSVLGKPVANNGTIAFGRYGRVDLSILFTLQHVGSSIDLDIIRDGKTMTVQATAKPFSRLVPLSEHDVKPRYFIYCGLVFQPLSYDYLDAIDGGSPVLTAAFYAGQQKADRLELVVLSHTLSDKVNIGYERITDAPIKSVNGQKIRDLADLVQKIESSTESYLRICTAEDQDVIVVPSPTNMESTEANKRILNRYKVSSDRCLEGGPSVNK